MKKIHAILFVLLFGTAFSNAQTTAMDFTMNDCNGQMHNLYSELDGGNVVIMEFFMLSCSGCIDAANDMEPMHQSLVSQYGSSKVRFYQTAFNNSYTCSSINNWVNSNGFLSVPFDSGAAQVAYYGGMGMPTIAVAAGNTHKLLFLSVGFSPSDTTTMGAAIRNFLDSTLAGVEDINATVSVSVLPNPASENFAVSLNIKEAGMLKLELTNIMGQRMTELTEEKVQTGTWNRNFTALLPNGVYFIKGSINEKPFYEKISIRH